ncbi:MAG TPA: methyltransferase domain-containing protein [Candidatus Dormibacteraeota bacterium]
MKSKDLYPAIFSRNAAAYQRRLEQVMALGQASGRQRAIDALEVAPSMKVLDLACGPGNLTRRLAALVQPGGEVVGVDLAEGMIELARNAGIPGARFEVMDIERLTFAVASFDAAICGHGLQFAPNLDRALLEAHRVLRPGGRFTASVPVTQVDGAAIWALLDTVIDRWLPPPPRAVDQDRTRQIVADPAALSQAAADAGFSSAAIETVVEKVSWRSADQVVSMCMSWWDCAARLEGVDSASRAGFARDAVEELRRSYPGEIETTGRNHVLVAIA